MAMAQELQDLASENPKQFPESKGAQTLLERGGKTAAKSMDFFWFSALKKPRWSIAFPGIYFFLRCVNMIPYIQSGAP